MHYPHTADPGLAFFHLLKHPPLSPPQLLLFFPAVHQMWKVYDQLTHQTNHIVQTNSQLSHTILSYNLRVLTISGPSPQAIHRPQRTRLNRSTPQSYDIRSCFAPGRPQVPSILPQHWQSPDHFINSTPLPTSPLQGSNNSFHHLPIEPITPREDLSQYAFPSPRTPPRHFQSAPIDPFEATFTLLAKVQLATQINHTYQEAAGDEKCLLNAFIMGLQFQTALYDPNLHCMIQTSTICTISALKFVTTLTVPEALPLEIFIT
jgi:hypothetical protein